MAKIRANRSSLVRAASERSNSQTMGCLGIAIFCVLVVCVSSDSHDHISRVSTYNTSLESVSHDSHAYDVISSFFKHRKHRTFIAFARPRLLGSLEDDADNGTDNKNCSASEDDFPKFFLDDDQIKHGGIIVCFLIGMYGFTLLACVCDGYFLPCVETICELLNLTPDVAAATFMSIATSTPELFTNMIGTFITKSDIGIGTIVGSSMFNALGVAAIGGLAAPFPLKLDWWPVTRDCFIYVCAICVLIVITWDGKIMWYEASVMMVIYVLYFTVMFQNPKISRWVKSKIGKKNKNLENVVVEPPTGDKKDGEPRVSIISAYGTYVDHSKDPNYEEEHRKTLEKMEEDEKEEARKTLFRKPEGTRMQKILFYYTWPIKLILRCTIPNARLYPKIFPLTFVVCIMWIGINSYVVSWMMSILGNLTNLPDAVLGMTLLAAGGCLPESISMTIIARRGEGAFGVSNSLGANTMAILFSLGMPWFFKNMVDGANSDNPIHIQSGSLEYTIMALILVACALYTTLALNKFRLSKLTGAILICVFVVMVALAVVSEMVFFPTTCE